MKLNKSIGFCPGLLVWDASAAYIVVATSLQQIRYRDLSLHSWVTMFTKIIKFNNIIVTESTMAARVRCGQMQFQATKSALSKTRLPQ